MKDFNKKICTKCKENKTLDKFCKRKSRKSGFASACKDCDKEYRKNNKEKISKSNKKYNEKNKEHITKYQKEYNKANKKTIQEKRKKFCQLNKETISKKRKEYKKNKSASNPLFKLKNNTQSLIRGSLKNSGYKKNSRTHEILKCSFKEFLEHLNNNPYKFSYGDKNIDIDHIIPISTANSEAEILELNHFSNLQLLPSIYNRYIKRENIFDKTHFEDWYDKT
jgi:hypothetical protein